MGEQTFTKPQPILDQKLVQSGQKTSTGKKILSVWLAANLVVTTLLTGTLFTPSLGLGSALVVIIAGTILGATVLAVVGSIGTRTGFATMELTRFSFGSAGSKLPAVGNLMVLMGWSWVQAMLAGVTVDALVSAATDYSNPLLWSVLCEVLVVTLAFFGHSLIAKVEPLFALLILACMGFLLWVCFRDIPLGEYMRSPAIGNPYTPTLAFDAVFATAISWTVLSADFNRFGAKTIRTATGSFVGYCLSTITAMSLGAILALYVFLQTGEEPAFDPVALVGSFGPVLAICVFLSVMATNTMVVFGMVNSAMSIAVAAKEHYRWTAVVVGTISIAGAAQIGLLDYFTNFLLLIGAFFVPVFAVMICDYFVVHRGEYSVNRVVTANWVSLLAWVSGCATALLFTYLWDSPVGATMTSFTITGLVFLGSSWLVRGNLQGS